VGRAASEEDAPGFADEGWDSGAEADGEEDAFFPQAQREKTRISARIKDSVLFIFLASNDI
jgi:hypothetical protein